MDKTATERAIFTAQTATKDGHTVSFFFNRETNLLVVDLIHKNDRGGNEIVRRTLEPSKLLKHCQ